MSGLFKLGWRDLVKGLVVAMLSVVFSTGIGALTGDIDPKVVAISCLSAAFAYLSKQLATDDQGKLGGKL